jgi:hypothetical protein
MEFEESKLAELRKLLNGVNLDDGYIGRGVMLTQQGQRKVADRFEIDLAAVPQMLQAVSAYVRRDMLSEQVDRYSFEADFMGNLTLRDNQAGRERFIQGDEAFKLDNELSKYPDRQQEIMSQYFDEPLVEGVEDDLPRGGGTFNFPYKGKFATARFGVEGGEFRVSVISLRDAEDNETDIDEALQTKLDAVAMTWVDKV